MRAEISSGCGLLQTPAVAPEDAKQIISHPFLRLPSRMIRLLTVEAFVCFSATANFVGSAVLGVVGVVTLTKVKHRRELLFATLPILFAIHQFIEGFVWLGLDGILSPVVAHDMGAAFMLYDQGLLPFILPLSVILFESDAKSRRRMQPFLVLGTLTALYILWALTAYPTQVFVKGNSIVYINQATNNEA